MIILIEKIVFNRVIPVNLFPRIRVYPQVFHSFAEKMRKNYVV